MTEPAATGPSGSATPQKGWKTWSKRRKTWTVVGGILVFGLILQLVVPKDVMYPDKKETASSVRTSTLGISGYLNDAPEPFSVKVTANADEQTFTATANSDKNISLALDCTTSQTQVYVELSGLDGRFRRGDWFPAKCGATWTYFVSISENDAGIIALNFLQDPGR